MKYYALFSPKKSRFMVNMYAHKIQFYISITIVMIQILILLNITLQG